MIRLCQSGDQHVLATVGAACRRAIVRCLCVTALVLALEQMGLALGDEPKQSPAQAPLDEPEGWGGADSGGETRGPACRA